MNLKFINYKITWETMETVEGQKTPPSLIPEIEKLYDEFKNPKLNTINKIQKLIKKYPKHAQLKNHLYAAYVKLGMDEKAQAVNDALLKTNPNYLFARIAKADHYMDQEQYEEAEKLLGKGFDLKILYPDREVFHASEFLSLQTMAVKYFASTDQFDEAEKRLDLMSDVDDESHQYKYAKDILSRIAMEKVQELIKQADKEIIVPTTNFHPEKWTKPAEFNCKDVVLLYGYEDDIPVELLNELLALYRKPLIEDLENVLRDSYCNYEEGQFSFAPTHALFMLGELEAEESLPVVFEMMRQGKAYFDDTFGDVFTEDAWIPLYKMGKNRLDLFEEYLKRPGLYTYFKTAARGVLVQTIHHRPERKKEVVQIFENLLDFYADATIEDNIIDSVFIGYFIADLTGLKLSQLLPRIKRLYEKGYVSGLIGKSLENVEIDIKDQEKYYSTKRPFMGIREIYDSFISYEDEGYEDEDDLSPAEEDDYYSNYTPIVNPAPKVGRNDPCPCGSGKKYKKCCLNNPKW